MSLQELFGRLWRDYAAQNPQVDRIHRLLAERGEQVVNDHIALRTFDLPEVGIDAMERAFVAHGYEPADSYEFPEKKLIAYHYEHPTPGLPKVFISALLVNELSDRAQEVIRGLVAQLPPALRVREDFVCCGRPWPVSYADYELLRGESEYAAWVAAFGFRANHFTVDVRSLKTVKDLEELNRVLKENGFELNSSGGEIKGGEEVYLAQSSTLADEVDVEFSDGTQRIPSCYYEFALRYPLPNGELFQGFVANSASRIFESTDHRQ